MANAGTINVIYGSPNGLVAAGDQMWHQDTTGIVDAAEQDDYFGWSLATGDFDDDGYADLAVGVPGEDHSGVVNAGLVHIFYGSSSGLGAARDVTWHQNSSGINDSAEANDYFGMALASGGFNGDFFDDLVVGIPYEDIGSITDAGAVQVLYGQASGLGAAGDQFWHQDSSGIEGAAEAYDNFGYALVAGYFESGSGMDLAVGVPGEDVGSIENAGAVNVLYGGHGSGGLSSSGNQLWHQDSPGIGGACETDDHFGRSLTAGDFDNDKRWDLVVGAPYEAIGPASFAGGINVIRGTSSGLTSVGNVTIHQNKIGETAEAFDFFGESLAVGAINNATRLDDLIIGVPRESHHGFEAAGLAHVLYGTTEAGITFDDFYSVEIHYDEDGDLSL